MVWLVSGRNEKDGKARTLVNLYNFDHCMWFPYLLWIYTGG